MSWQLIAEGTPDGFENSVPSVSDVPSGTRLRLEITTTLPIAPLFDLWGAEWVVDYMIDQGEADIVDVEGIGWNKIVVHMIAHSHVILIIIAICAVLAIAGIAYIVHELRLFADIAGPAIMTFIVIAGVAVAALLGYSIYRIRRSSRNE
mgnify:CR=1 FL=1